VSEHTTCSQGVFLGSLAHLVASLGSPLEIIWRARGCLVSWCFCRPKDGRAYRNLHIATSGPGKDD
jgi:hypothetical protein